MKQTFITGILWICFSSLFGQMVTSSETEYQFSRIAQAIKGNSPDPEWIQTYVPDLPIYLVNGEYCLSLIAKVEKGYSPRDLTGIGYPGSQAGSIATIKIPLARISANLTIPHVSYLEISGKIHPDLHKLTVDIRADSVWSGYGLPQGYTGKGVLIGISDWGFDYGHPMFKDTSLTNTRIRAAWDQFKIAGTPPAGMLYGAEYDTPQALAAALSDTAGTYYDFATHGNHVAGIAGGSGAGTVYRGVAFESELLFASLQLDAGSAIDAFNWMKAKADAEGKRLVSNMSWGLYHIGTLDGTSLLGQAIDHLSSQGVVFVTSAGNNGNVDFHLKKDFLNDTLRSRISFYGYSLHPSMWGQSITMWGEYAKPFGARLEVFNAAGTLLDTTPFFSTHLHPGSHDSFMVAGTDTILFHFIIDDTHPLNQRPHIRLRVKNTNTSLRVVLCSAAPTGRVHYWNVVELSNGVGNWGQPFYAFGQGGMDGDANYGLGEPACNEGVITVAAHAPDVVLTNCTVIYGSKAGFSSFGPTYDERVKPDLSAPGVNVISSINSYTTAQYSTTAQIQHLGKTYHFAPFSGTSMSSPAVAGAVALLLEAKPYLSANQVKEILKTSARQDPKTGTLNWPGSTAWGMGKLTANHAIQLALNPVSPKTPIGTTDITVFPNPTPDHILVDLPAETHEEINYTIYNAWGHQVSIGVLPLSRSISLSHLESGIYILRLSAANQYTIALRVVKI
jgi:minor extracellular serine protease Vpr